MGLQYKVIRVILNTVALLMAALVAMTSLIEELSTKSKFGHIE